MIIIKILELNDIIVWKSGSAKGRAKSKAESFLRDTKYILWVTTVNIQWAK